jgi:hypothetical protein
VVERTSTVNTTSTISFTWRVLYVGRSSSGAAPGMDEGREGDLLGMPGKVGERPLDWTDPWVEAGGDGTGVGDADDSELYKQTHEMRW